MTNFRQAHLEFHSPCLLVSGQYWSLRINRKHTYSNFCLLECIKQMCLQQGMAKMVGALLLYLQTCNTVGRKFSLFYFIQVSKKEWMSAAMVLSSCLLTNLQWTGKTFSSFLKLGISGLSLTCPLTNILFRGVFCKLGHGLDK